MVYLYGGGYTYGQATMYGADFFMEQNVVLVTVNYRVGALGFLSIDDPKFDVPGNAGLKDQTLALRWVRANIRQFGGDPQQVTLFGQSAGGASVHFHLMSPMSRGLFQRAILQSGSALSPWAVTPFRDAASRLALALGWNGAGGTAATATNSSSCRSSAYRSLAGNGWSSDGRTSWFNVPVCTHR